MNPLKGLQQYGQSVWLDYIHRHLMSSGELTRLVEEDGLRGVTSNPTIFEKAIADSPDYDEALRGILHLTLVLTSVWSTRRWPSRISAWRPTSCVLSTMRPMGPTAS